MKILEIDENIEKALVQVMDFALKANGISVWSSVDLLMKSVQVKKDVKEE